MRSLFVVTATLAIGACSHGGGSVCDEGHKGPKRGAGYQCKGAEKADGDAPTPPNATPGSGSTKPPGSSPTTPESPSPQGRNQAGPHDLLGRWVGGGMDVTFESGNIGIMRLPILTSTPQEDPERRELSFTYSVERSPTSTLSKLALTIAPIGESTNPTVLKCIYRRDGTLLLMQCADAYPESMTEDVITLRPSDE